MTSRRRAVLTALTLLAMTACATSPSASPTPGLTPTPEPTATPTPVPTPEPTPTPLLPDNALLPNLVMEPLDEWHVELREGRRLLRVTTIFSNYGVGAFDLRGGRASATDDVMLLDQIVFTDSGGMRRLDDVVEARYAGDGHDHWHAQGVVTMALSPVGSPTSVTVGQKIHFCFFDNVRTNEELEEFRTEGYYTRAWCGTPESMTVRMGLSIGWGDRYGWDFPYQQIDITGLAGGTYELRATVDVNDAFVETDDTDNCTMSRFVLPGSGTGQIITVEASSQPC